MTVYAGMYYVKEWSESAGGGSSMCHAEYVTLTPPAPRRERQSNGASSGFDCVSVHQIRLGEEGNYDDLEVRD